MAITQEAKNISDSIKSIPNLSSNSSHKYDSTQKVLQSVFDLNDHSTYLYTLSGTGNIVVRTQQAQMQVNKGSKLEIVVAVCTFDFKDTSGYAKYALELLNHYGVNSVVYSWLNSSNEYIPKLAFGIQNSKVVNKIKEVWPEVVVEEVKKERKKSGKDSVIGTGKNIIFFGAPGTGKSYKIDQIVNELDKKYWERITFHPEFDYASFVGGYKPISEKVKISLEGEPEKFKEEIKYTFTPQAFTNIYIRAWEEIDEEIPYYLCIEEINRGNCSEIFGDIFQLLDRKSNYSVSPSKELQDHLIEKLGEGHEGVKNGLKLPPNLSIIASMNTSDQSLFPMDSAFKRRWDWEYIPINYEENYTDEEDDFEAANKSYDYVLVDSNEKEIFRWVDFIKTVNIIIKNNPNLGMDKCIGNFFVQPEDDKTITLKIFINKVIFYLWNDVFKDEEDSDNIFPQGKFYEDFFPIKKNGIDMIHQIVQKINEIAEIEKFEKLKTNQ
ncbi:AAA family ATPase [Saprospiraceae bacterium]|nr:AAA family ATPase [Saprospiraceae bacterium]